MSTRALVVGDRVRVPWGLDLLEGEVVNLYDTGSGPRVVVRVAVRDAGDESDSVTVALPADVVEPLGEPSEGRAPGEWVAGLRYERSLGEAVERVLARLGPPSVVEHRSSPSEMDADYAARVGDRLILIEAKAERSRRKLPVEAVRQLLGYLYRRLEESGRDSPGRQVAGLLVTNQDLTESAQRLLNSTSNLEAVRWRGPDDDDRLAAALESLLQRPLEPR